MKGYKAFEKGMVCRGKQYAENTVFEEPTADICSKGMHFCEDPFDVLDYYPLVDNKGKFSEFAEVEPLDDVKTDDQKKFCTTKLKIGAKLSFPGFVKACVDFMIEKTSASVDERSSSYNAKIGSSGDYAKIGSSGRRSVVCCAGANAIAKARVGSWITLSEWKRDTGENACIPICVKTEYVDGERIKKDTWYKLVDGEFTEVTV